MSGVNDEVEEIGEQRNCPDESAQVFEGMKCNSRLNHDWYSRGEGGKHDCIKVRVMEKRLARHNLLHDYALHLTGSEAVRESYNLVQVTRNNAGSTA